MSRVAPLRRPARRANVQGDQPRGDPGIPKRRHRRAGRAGLGANGRAFIVGWFVAKILALGVLAAGGWGLSYAASAPSFAVNQVVVRGNVLVPTEEILSVLSIEGTNAFLVQGSSPERVLQANPAIERVDVEPRLPGSVLVFIQERSPAVIWRTGGPELLVDAGGLVLREANGGAAQAPGLPVVVAADNAAVRPGGRVDAEAVRAAQSLGPNLDRLGYAGGWVEFRPTTGVTLVGPGGPRAVLGSDADLDAKLAAYLAIRRKLDETRTPAELIDVRFLDRPYFR
ncbi:MAG: FtsQ-type POTRA domain-containing protein [Chloroflexi bacterium]|nr:FtsQ-type POTRA domain-containing protein [Chloroflexota bacterium]